MRFPNAIVIGVLILLLLGCITNVLEPPAAYVKYLREPTDTLVDCEKVKELVGVPAGIWQGRVGNQEARQDLRNQAFSIDANVVLETDSSWFTGKVWGTAYRCPGIGTSANDNELVFRKAKQCQERGGVWINDSCQIEIQD